MTIRTDNIKNYVSYLYIMFTIIITTWFLAHDNHKKIKLWYSITLFLLLLFRCISYYRKEYLLHMLEMCYFINLVSIFYVQSNYDIRYIYPFMHGPLMVYSLIYGDAFIPHDLAKTTSYSIHTFGSVITRRLYWNGDSKLWLSWNDLPNNFYHYLYWCLILYLTWLIPYCIYLYMYDGNMTTMIKYVYRLNKDDIISSKQKIQYICGHMFFIIISLIIGIISMHCWQMNYFIVACQIISGFIHGGCYYYTGHKMNFFKMLLKIFIVVKNKAIKIKKII